MVRGGTAWSTPTLCVRLISGGSVRQAEAMTAEAVFLTAGARSAPASVVRWVSVLAVADVLVRRSQLSADREEQA